jgi:hypothetical protein
MAKENQLSYYSAKLLKDALIELGYTEVAKIRNKKDLIVYITNLIQTTATEPYLTDSDDDSEDEPITIVDMTHILKEVKKL